MTELVPKPLHVHVEGEFGDAIFAELIARIRENGGVVDSIFYERERPQVPAMGFCNVRIEATDEFVRRLAEEMPGVAKVEVKYAVA